MSDYWKIRQESTYKAGEMRVNQYFTKLEKAFNQTKRELNTTIESFYFRYAQENGLTYAAAQRQLDKAEIGELKDFIDLSMQNIGKYNQEVNNLSVKARITRYQALEKQVDAMLRQLYAVDYQAAAEQTMQEVYQDSFYRTWYNIDQYHGFHSNFAQIEPRTIEALLQYPFNGANFSNRLWKQKEHLQSRLMEAVTTVLVQGANPERLAGELAKKMTSKKFDAYRLLHTESSFLMSEATHAAYREDGVEKYQVLATLDSKTCGICGELDGKVYEVSKAVVGENMSPFHPLCRCTDVPYDGDLDLSGETRAAKNANGEYVEVPADIAYGEWKKVVDEGGDFEKWKQDKADSDKQKQYAARREEWKKRQAEKDKALEADLTRTGIVFDMKGKDEKFKSSIDSIKRLAGEYNTRLRRVTVGAHQAAGDTDMYGLTMHLNSNTPDTVFHEFAHSLAIAKTDKLGITDNTDFWKEIRAVRTRYRKAVRQDYSYSISSYANSGGGSGHGDNLDEFFAEAFSQAKMKEYGFELPEKYGKDFMYSKEVLDITDKYFGNAEREFSPRKSTKGNFGVNWEKVNSPEYRNSIEKLSDSPRVVNAIEVRSKCALNNRDGLKTEEMYAVSMDTGDEIASILDQQIEYGVNRTPAFTRRLNEAEEAKENILLIHNHPKGLPPSITDINMLLKNEKVSGITVGHDGSIYYYTRPKKEIPNDDFNVAMRHFNKYTESTAIEKALEILGKQYGFTVSIGNCETRSQS